MKYRGKLDQITYRSLPERRIMVYFDTSDKVLEWNSEGIIIPYFFSQDRKMHRYYMDFYAKIRHLDGSIGVYLFEYKPESKMDPPKLINRKVTPKRQRRYLAEKWDWHKNQDKWKHAQAYAQKNNIMFIVLNEKHIKNMNFFNTL